MKITKSQFKQILKEEIKKTLTENELSADDKEVIGNLKRWYTEVIDEIVVDEDDYGDTVFIVRYREGYGEDSEHYDLEEAEDEIVRRAEDPTNLVRQWTREKPLPSGPDSKMTPEQSEKIFLHQLLAGVFGEIRSTGEAKDAYDKLYRRLDPHDRSHLPVQSPEPEEPKKELDPELRRTAWNNGYTDGKSMSDTHSEKWEDGPYWEYYDDGYYSGQEEQDASSVDREEARRDGLKDAEEGTDHRAEMWKDTEYWDDYLNSYQATSMASEEDPYEDYE